MPLYQECRACEEVVVPGGQPQPAIHLTVSSSNQRAGSRLCSALSQFHFENMKLKAQQRIREGRQQPVDPLAVNLFLMPEFDASVSAPHAIFIGLTLFEVEDVRDEIMTWQVGSPGNHHCLSRQGWQ